MNKFKILFLLILITFISSCKHLRKGNVEIDGLFNNGYNEKIFLCSLEPDDLIIIDSTIIDKNNSFSFSFNTEETGFYILKISDKNYITLLIEPDETITLKGDALQLFDSYSIEGSKGSILIKQLNYTLSKSYKKVDSLSTIFKKIQGQPDFIEKKTELDTCYYRIINEHRKYLNDFITNNPQTLACIIAVYQNLGQRSMFTLEENFDLFNNVCNNLYKVYPKNKHVVALKSRVDKIKEREILFNKAKLNLQIDSIAPEISLMDTSGNRQNLTSLRGKYILIDFWASWCAPCRMLNPELIKLYKRYKSKGFDIYGVALEKNHSEWVNAIKNDKIPWMQVSDLKYWSSPIVTEYNITEIPRSILIDKEGRIIDIDVKIEELENLLKKLLKPIV